jgi:cytochrome d ubiquinol oxidase subunit I
MGKFLRVLVVIIFILTIASLTLATMLFFKRELLKGRTNKLEKGLESISLLLENEPPVAILFWSFRVMVGLGFAMLGLGAWSLLQRLRGRLYEGRLLQRAAILMGPTGFVAVLAGWITTEVGRQPFTVYGLLRTSDSLAPVAAPAVVASLLAFIIVYFFVFGAGTFYLLRMMNNPAGSAPIVVDAKEPKNV